MKVCPDCKSNFDDEGALYCKYCGAELETQQKIPAKLYISVVDQNVLLDMLREEFGYAMKKAEEREKPIKKPKVQETSFLKKTVQAEGIRLYRESEEGKPTKIGLAVSHPGWGEIPIWVIGVDDEDVVPDIWNDLTDILLCPIDTKTKQKRFVDFTTKGKPYEKKVKQTYFDLEEPDVDDTDTTR